MADFTKIEESVYQYQGNKNPFPDATDEMVRDFAVNGYIIIRDHFNKIEIDKVNAAFANCKDVWEAAYRLKDATGKEFEQVNWIYANDDITGMVVRSHKTAKVCEQLLNRGELYLYSGKLIMKEPRNGGSVEWHQDYGYWYNNRAIYPDFITNLTALTKSDFENGGVMVVKGSHLCGRIEHSKVAGQTGADLERVNLIMKTLPVVQMNLHAGDSVLFHGNTLHKSGPNTADSKRWNLVIGYNTKHNSPDRVHYNAQYNRLGIVPADAVETMTDANIDAKDYTNPTTNPNVNPNV